MFMVGSSLSGRFMLRLAVGSPQTQPRHVAAAWARVAREADGLLAERGAGVAAAAGAAQQ
jgi:hypothetical protein